jgi:hypothetical protein
MKYEEFLDFNTEYLKTPVHDAYKMPTMTFSGSELLVYVRALNKFISGKQKPFRLIDKRFLFTPIATDIIEVGYVARKMIFVFGFKIADFKHNR